MVSSTAPSSSGLDLLANAADSVSDAKRCYSELAKLVQSRPFAKLEEAIKFLDDEFGNSNPLSDAEVVKWWMKNVSGNASRASASKRTRGSEEVVKRRSKKKLSATGSSSSDVPRYVPICTETNNLITEALVEKYLDDRGAPVSEGIEIVRKILDESGYRYQLSDEAIERRIQIVKQDIKGERPIGPRDPAIVAVLKRIVAEHPNADHKEIFAHLEEQYGGLSPINMRQVYDWIRENCKTEAYTRISENIDPSISENFLEVKDEIISRMILEFLEKTPQGLVIKLQEEIHKALNEKGLGTIGYKVLCDRVRRMAHDEGITRNSPTHNRLDKKVVETLEELFSINPKIAGESALQATKERLEGKTSLSLKQVQAWLWRKRKGLNNNYHGL